ncbi:spondin-1 [Onthophagus taurus]|uniref:spondin-1 n=1 Tax=Onthophagus taurus TaxID=166361 RepID=UPI000C1FE712|nr:spondin-1 [Onthophagus taurus]
MKVALWGFIFVLGVVVVLGCPREPSPYHSHVGKLEGDNGFQIKVNENPEKYIPGQIYTMYLMGSRTFENVQHFKRFTINVESSQEPGNLSPQKVGTFQLFGDSLSKFNEDCVNTISETSVLPKTEVFFMWKAPPPGSGCVTFRAMVLEDSKRWFADEGKLSKTFCEQTENDLKFNPDDCCACDEAKYNLIFEGIWSNKTHPKDFPFSLWLTHFSDIIGASHERNFTFWGEGQIASEGFRSLAEWGSVRLMESELRAKSKYLRSIIKAAGLWYPHVNTNTSATFKVDRRHNLISLASMFGPTPDWVVGVNGLNLCLRNCTWIENLILDLYPYDAGTDSGITYMSPNSETKPREKMYRITTTYPEDPRAPFYDPSKNEMHPLARMYLTREKVIPKSCDEKFLNAQLEVEVNENTEDTSRVECSVTEYSSWSDCSVTCGKGLRMRTREYKMPQKAQMFSCNRQLVSKEMCVAAVPECENKPAEDSEEKLEVNDGICATTEWTLWSECSSTCGVGMKTRSRQFLDAMGRKKCPHISTMEKEKCMEPPCQPDQIEVPDPMCPVSEWNDFSPCSASCGKGVKFRTRLLLVEPGLQEKCSSRVELMQQRPCMDYVDCTFDMATAKRVCMEEPIQGPCTGYFNRWYFEPSKQMCVPFVYGGCRGNRNNFLTVDECNEACKIMRGEIQNPNLAPTASPAIDCMVSDWSPWSGCSVSCGKGFQYRQRMIKREPENNGKPCPNLTKRKKCIRAPCL